LKKILQGKGGHLTKPAAIFLMTILILSVAIIGTTAYGRKANATTAEEVCQSFEMSCEETTPATAAAAAAAEEEEQTTTPAAAEEEEEQTTTPAAAPSSSKKFFVAVFLQYVGKDTQVEIYEPNMGREDQTHLRVEGDDELKRRYIRDALSLPGSAGVSFKSSEAIIENAARVKNLGFEFIDFNLESGLSPRSDTNDVVEAMRRAAQAVHEEGLKFRATPSKEYTTEYGSQIASFADYYHIQAQSLQGDGVKAYSDYVHSIISKLKNANPDLVINVQVSTQQDNARGLSLLETLKRCTNAIMDVADGVSLWYGSSDLNRLESYVEWYDAKY
jgi:hypothetical protein